MIGKVKVTSADLGPSMRVAYRVYIDNRHIGTMGQAPSGVWHTCRSFRRILSRRFDTRQEALGFLLDEHFFNTVTEHDE